MIRDTLGVVRYEIPDGHTHQLVVDCAYLDGATIEDYAMELAEAVAQCNENRHVDSKGVPHGRSHSSEDVKNAHKAAVEQLLTKDLPGEVAELRQKIAAHKRWGGQVPAAVIMPMQDGRTRAVVPDKYGTPYVYDVKKGLLDGIVPTPEQAGAVPDKQGIGYLRRRRWSPARKLRGIDAKLQQP